MIRALLIWLAEAFTYVSDIFYNAAQPQFCRSARYPGWRKACLSASISLDGVSDALYGCAERMERRG